MFFHWTQLSIYNVSTSSKLSSMMTKLIFSRIPIVVPNPAGGIRNKSVVVQSCGWDIFLS